MSATTTAGPPSGAGLPSGQIDLRGRARPAESVIKCSVGRISALLSIAISFGIVIALVRPVIDFLKEVPFGDFFATEGEFAVIPLLSGTLVVTAIALIVAVPLGLGAAMYLSEYASPRARKILKPTVELLAGVPSVVYGFFAVAFVTPTLLQKILNLEVNFTNALAAGLVLGVMIVPTIASLSEDAMSAVPAGDAPGLPGHGRQPDADHAAGGLPRGPLRYRGRDRAGHVAGDRRDDDRRPRRRLPAEPVPRPP